MGRLWSVAMADVIRVFFGILAIGYVALWAVSSLFGIAPDDDLLDPDTWRWPW